MSFQINKNKYYILDGAMGTMLQKRGLSLGERPELLSLSDPDIVTEIHRAYLDAGADVIYTNTFGANELKLEGTGKQPEEIIEAAVFAAHKAAHNK